MKTVKQVLMTERELSLESDEQILESLVHLGLLEQGRANLVKRAMYTNTAAMTMAEKKSMIGLMESLIAHVLHEKKDHLAKLDTRRAPGYPSEREIPVVLILKRKALRVYPDNQKVAMYYSQALDKYISIPFGPQSDELGIHMNEETKEEMRKIKFGSHDTVELKESAPRATFRSKLDTIREEREGHLDEALPAAVAAVAGAVRVGSAAVKIGSKIGRGIKRLGLSAQRNARDWWQAQDNSRYGKGSGGGGNDAVRKAGSTAADAGQHETGRELGKVTSPIDKQSSYLQGAPLTATQLAVNKRMQLPESTNLDVIRSIVDNDLKEDTVAFGDNRISINNRTAKKIIGIHESLNRTNQRKFEKMLNESAVSFRKAINFVVKVR